MLAVNGGLSSVLSVALLTAKRYRPPAFLAQGAAHQCVDGNEQHELRQVLPQAQYGAGGVQGASLLCSDHSWVLAFIPET